MLEFPDLPESDLDDSSGNLARLSSNPVTTEDKDAELRNLRTDCKKLTDMVKEYKILLNMYR